MALEVSERKRSLSQKETFLIVEYNLTLIFLSNLEVTPVYRSIHKFSTDAGGISKH
jgi:hypothetical protein